MWRKRERLAVGGDGEGKFPSFFLRAFKIIHYFGSFTRNRAKERKRDIFLVPQKNESTYDKDDDVEEETEAKLLCFIFIIIVIIKSSDDDALGAPFRDSVCG